MSGMSESKPALRPSRNEVEMFTSGAVEHSPAESQLSAIEKATHYAWLCRCHRDLWGPICAPYLHGTVPIVLDVDTAKRIVTCLTCRGEMEKRGMLDG